MVSIPFREDLYSDNYITFRTILRKQEVFPSLSGKTSIRTHRIRPLGGRPPRVVSIPFREDLYSDEICLKLFYIAYGGSFHPFQGRPLFGLVNDTEALKKIPHRFVSIPFREDLYSDQAKRRGLSRSMQIGFHPFQGRPLFGHFHRPTAGRVHLHRVSIPFREDLYSDCFCSICEMVKL